MSGHSKWHNIQAKKGKADAARGKIFTKIGREIAIAVREGGPDPNVNGKLRDIIAKAKANNMPNDNIQRSIKKASGEGGGVNYEEFSYEGYAPGGVAVIVNLVTDNRNRTSSDIRHIFDKNGGIIYNGNYRDDKINSVDFNLYKNDDYYNCKTRSFSIKAEGTAGNWLVNQESDSVQNLIETRTGSTLIKNYGKYTSVEDCVDHTGYIYAFSCIDGQTLKGDFDVYACSVDRNSTALPVLSGKAVFKENHHLV